LALGSRASGLDALLRAVFDLFAVAGYRLGLAMRMQAVEVGLRRGEVGLGRAALHGGLVVVYRIYNHCVNGWIGYIHGVGLWLI